jgi:aminoglycoside 6-adenylyltransferase
MREEHEVLKEIIEWASGTEMVRTVILTGSRAHPQTRTDIFSDYDIEVGVNSLERLLNNREWLYSFGEILTQICEESDDFSMQMVLYKDFTRIDFKIYAVTYLNQYIEQNKLPAHLDNGYRILVDKDDITKGLQEPGFKAYVIKKPTEEEFLSVVNDFWWDTTYVAKSLWRKELFYAKYMLDNIIRFSYLQRMIEWKIGCQYNWQISTNKNGRFFKQYLDTATWAALQDTFSGGDIAENWNALMATTQLFRHLATTIAAELNYPYPQKTDLEISQYLEKVKNLT